MAYHRNPYVYMDISVYGLPAKRITIELLEDTCPRTAKNFQALCTGERGIGFSTRKPLYYKGSTFHSIIGEEYAQGGDFSHEDGSGGESIYGGKFEDENFDIKHDCEGLLSMANDGKKHANGSQFFITFKALPHLNGKNVVFGKVVKGIEGVRQIKQVLTDEQGKPKSLVIITACGELPDSETPDAREAKTDSSSPPHQRKRRVRGDSEHHRSSLSPISTSKRISKSIESGEIPNSGGQKFSRNSSDEASTRGRSRYHPPDGTKEKITRRQSSSRRSHDSHEPRHPGQPNYHSPDGTKEKRTRRRSSSRRSHESHEPRHRGRPNYHSPDGTKEKRTRRRSSSRRSHYSHEARHHGRPSYHSPDGTKERRTRRQSSSRRSHYAHEPRPRDRSPRRVPHRRHLRDESYSKKSPLKHYKSNLRGTTPPSRRRSTSRSSSDSPARQSPRHKPNEWPNLSERLRARLGPPSNNDDTEPAEGPAI